MDVPYIPPVRITSFRMTAHVLVSHLDEVPRDVDRIDPDSSVSRKGSDFRVIGRSRPVPSKVGGVGRGRRVDFSLLVDELEHAITRRHDPVVVFVWLELSCIEYGREVGKLLLLVFGDELDSEWARVEAWVWSLGEEVVENLGWCGDVHGGNTVGFGPDEYSEEEVCHLVLLRIDKGGCWWKKVV